MRRFSLNTMLFAVILISCVGCDQITKQWASEHLKGTGARSYLGDTVRLHYIENPGVFLGLGSSLSPTTRFWLFTVMNIVLLVGLFWLGRSYWCVNRSMLSLGALFFAGGIGNTLDRIVYDGRVIDFLNLGIGSFRTGIFNVADMAISCSAALLLLFALRDESSVGTSR